MPLNRKLATGLLPLALFLSGCGGDSTPSAAPAPLSSEPASEQEAQADGQVAPTIDEASIPESTALPPAMPAEGVELIAFISALGGDFEIFVVEPDGHNLLQLTDNDAQDFAPAWSPDGTRIAFHSDRDGNEELYVMGADGSEVTRLTDDPVADTFPVWSPDGQRLAFVSARGGKADVWLVEMGTGSLTQLTDDETDPSNLDWSPDGTTIAFTASRQGEGSVVVVPVDSPGATVELAQDAFYPDWSPDGSMIAYAVQGTTLNVAVARADGSDAVALTQDVAQHHSPSFSPDGSRIVFVSQTDAASDLWVMNADGSEATQITQDMNPLMPRWSP